MLARERLALSGSSRFQPRKSYESRRLTTNVPYPKRSERCRCSGCCPRPRWRDSRQAFIERNAGYSSTTDTWSIRRVLTGSGRTRHVPAIRGSALWNVNHVDEGYDPRFLDVLEERA